MLKRSRTILSKSPSKEVKPSIRLKRRKTLEYKAPIHRSEDQGGFSIYSSKQSDGRRGNYSELENLKKVMNRYNRKSTSSAGINNSFQQSLTRRKSLTLQGKSGQLEDNLLQSEFPRFAGMQDRQKSKVMRMMNRVDKVKFIIYPQDSLKEYWDLYITIILFVTCILTPYNIAFGKLQQDLAMFLVNLFIDLSFCVDMIIIFNTAFYDDEFHIVDDRYRIVNSYLKSWFLIDFLSVFPLDQILISFENVNDLARLARLGRMYKLIKMLKLLRVLKIVKERSKILKYLNDFLKIGLGFERIFFFMIIYLILLHVMTCVFIIAG